MNAMRVSRKKSPRSEAAQRRRNQLAELARVDILRAAGTAFAQRGFHATTLQQIAEAAGFTAASLYTYFPSKEAIYRELVETIHQELRTPLTCKYPKEAGFEERLSSLLQAICEVADRRRDTLGFLLRVLSREDSRPLVHQHQLTEFLDQFEEWVRKNAPPESLRCSNDEAGLALWALLNGHLVRWITRGDTTESLMGSASEIRDLFLHGVSPLNGASDPRTGRRPKSR